MPKNFGAYDAVLLANLIDRLPDPMCVHLLPVRLSSKRADSLSLSRKCLDVLPHLVKPGGIILITSPYTWLEQFTHPSKWMGGYLDGGTPLSFIRLLLH